MNIARLILIIGMIFVVIPLVAAPALAQTTFT